jgi:hypothetical protein
MASNNADSLASVLMSLPAGDCLATPHYRNQAAIPDSHWLSATTDGSRAIAQAVSRWLPTSAVRGSRPGRHVGFCGGQSGAGADFLRVLRFPLPN